MENSKTKYMQRAIVIAKENIQKGGGPFGAIIVKNDIIIAEAGNSVTIDNDPTAHAEINAIRIAAKKLKSFDLSDCDIYSSCEPCPMCLAAIYWANIKTLYFAATKEDAAKAGFNDLFIYQEFSKPITKRNLKTQKILSDISKEAFKEWEKYEHKIRY